MPSFMQKFRDKPTTSSVSLPQPIPPPSPAAPAKQADISNQPELPKNPFTITPSDSSSKKRTMLESRILEQSEPKRIATETVTVSQPSSMPLITESEMHAFEQQTSCAQNFFDEEKDRLEKTVENLTGILTDYHERLKDLTVRSYLLNNDVLLFSTDRLTDEIQSHITKYSLEE